ncbi:cytochrome-c peroxidase [Campylobacter troglodytis]|uniref:cytochrome-c peroxidase n=1 Tax=Campylobacter troglodytis TaxID=654363 RepID=UPI0011596263|nr:cytochrome c peroxidase [Campylobacter troglodytis]TQR54212.1 cytochrome-c peroxidase [Campylobacter troglodytis]
MSKFTKPLSFILIFVLFCLIEFAMYLAKNSQEKTFVNLNLTKYANLNVYKELYARPVSQWPRPILDESVRDEWEEFAILAKPSFPKDNAYSDIKAFLGLKLFNEPRLSKSGQISCQNCHHPDLAFTDGLKLSHGHDRQSGKRNSISIQASAFFDKLFWDARASSLEEQVLFPITDPLEMANTLENAQKAIKNLAYYYPLFVASFAPSEAQILWAKQFPKLYAKDEKERFKNLLEFEFNENKLLKLPQSELERARELINIENIAKAIATYERSSLVPRNSRFNNFLKGDYKSLNEQELYGLHLFRTKAGCMNCHYGAILSDGKLHNIGLSFFGRILEDLGRYEISKDTDDLGKFKTPSLLSVSKTAPYMHTGTFPSLRGVLNMYNVGFEGTMSKDKEGDPLLPKTSPLIKRLDLSREELLAIEAFLKTL